MLAKRLIPCLDIKEGRVVKGVNFVGFRDAGDPVELAKYYNEQGADELSFLDITASYEKRETVLEIVRRVAEQVFIPLSVGGGIRSVDDMQKILATGAEKISIGTGAVRSPEIVREAAKRFGSQAIVLSIDAKRNSGMKSGFEVLINGGKTRTGLDALEFAERMQGHGAGEILLNSIDRDGTKKGFDLLLCSMFSERLSIPIIASGGAGTFEDIRDVLTKGKADAALAASIFHYKECSINDVKEYLEKSGIEVRR